MCRQVIDKAESDSEWNCNGAEAWRNTRKSRTVLTWSKFPKGKNLTIKLRLHNPTFQTRIQYLMFFKTVFFQNPVNVKSCSIPTESTNFRGLRKSAVSIKNHLILQMRRYRPCKGKLGLDSMSSLPSKMFYT